MSTSELYRHSQYYDTAFSWDITGEIDILEACFRQHAAPPVEHLLEPACGSGRFLRALPQRGYHVTGYDLSPEMIAYARDRIQAAGLSTSVTILQADMRTARFDFRFDAAFNSINSIGHLQSDDDIRAHLDCTAAALKTGGIYVVQIGCAPESTVGIEPLSWSCERDGLRVTTTWGHVDADPQQKIQREFSRLEVEGPNGREVIEAVHVMRRWSYADLCDLVRQSAFSELTAIYDEQGRPVDLGADINADAGNLFYVLQRS